MGLGQRFSASANTQIYLLIFAISICVSCYFFVHGTQRLVYLVGIMSDFPWRPLVKQVGPTGRNVSSSTAAPTAGEGGQPAVEVGPIAGIVEIPRGAPSSALNKRK